MFISKYIGICCRYILWAISLALLFFSQNDVKSSRDCLKTFLLRSGQKNAKIVYWPNQRFFWHFFHLGYYNVKFYSSLNWSILLVSCRDYWKKNNCTFFRIYPHCVCLWQSWNCRCKILQVKKKSLQHPRNMRILASFECMHKIKWKSQNIFEKICLSLSFLQKK